MKFLLKGKGDPIIVRPPIQEYKVGLSTYNS